MRLNAKMATNEGSSNMLQSPYLTECNLYTLSQFEGKGRNARTKYLTEVQLLLRDLKFKLFLFASESQEENSVARL